MMLYKAWGYSLASNVSLPELIQLADQQPQYKFYVRSKPDWSPNSYEWFHHRTFPDGHDWLSCARNGSSYLLRFHGLADFLVSIDGCEVCGYPEPGVPLDTIRHLFLDNVFPLLLHQRRHLVLHASAVVAPEGAIAFLGMSGWGKSTLTASLWQQGFPLLTDDCLLLKEKGGLFFGTPSYPGVRLWPDSLGALLVSEPTLPSVAHYSDKKRLGLDIMIHPMSPDAAPLRRFYVLTSPDEVEKNCDITVMPMAAQDALIELLKNSFRLDIDDRERLQEEFEALSRLAALSYFYRLTFPRDTSSLPAVYAAILANLQEE